MDIVTALGGAKWFNYYAGLLLISLLTIALALLVIMFTLMAK